MRGLEHRKSGRVEFDYAFLVYLIAIDGTWRRDCLMRDVADSGAKLTVRQSIDGLNLKECFLLLSSTGCAYRRCKLAWVDGDEVGVNFIKPSTQRQPAATASAG